MNRQRVILVLSPFFTPNVGGVETHLDDLCTALAEGGWNVEVLTYRPLTARTSWQRREFRDGVVIRRLWWPAGRWFHLFEGSALLQFLYLVPRLLLGTFRRMLRADRPDVVHAHGFAAAFVGRLLCPVFGSRLIFSSHAIYEMYASAVVRRVMAWVLRGCHRVFALSEPSRQEIMAMGIPGDRVAVYTHWVDVDRFKPASPEQRALLRRASGLPADRPVALFFGRLIEKKGVRLAVQLAQRMPEIHVVIAGSGPLSDEVAQAAQSVDNLTYLGPVPAHESHRIYQCADILLVPSQYEEGFGRVVIEAMACGLQIVASNHGALPAVLAGTPGVCVEATIDAFESALRHAAQALPETSDAPSGMRAVAEQLYSPSNARIFLDACEEVSAP